MGVELVIFKDGDELIHSIFRLNIECEGFVKNGLKNERNDDFLEQKIVSCK